MENEFWQNPPQDRPFAPLNAEHAAQTNVVSISAQTENPQNPKKPRRSLLDMGVGRFAGEPPAQRWAVGAPSVAEGLVPASEPIVLIGQGGVGKTSAAIELCIAMAVYAATGRDQFWMGQTVKSGGVCVVLTWEESTDRLWRAVKKMCDARGVDVSIVAKHLIVKSYQDIDVDPLPLVGLNPQTRMPEPTEEYNALLEELDAVREQWGEIGAIVVDNVGTAFAVDGNSYQSVNQTMRWIQRWSARYGCLTAVIAHTNKGALEFEDDNPSDNELEKAAMGSTGWISAGRMAMVMWALSEGGEAELAKTLKDKEFKPGVTRRRYIRARVVKSNVDGIYTGTFTLKRAGGKLEDVSGTARTARAKSAQSEIEDLAQAIGRAWALNKPLQKTGVNGVWENRISLGKRFQRGSKNGLQNLVDRALTAGLIRIESEHPSMNSKKNANWLCENGDTGVMSLYREELARLIKRSKQVIHPDDLPGMRDRLHGLLGHLTDDELKEAVLTLKERKLISFGPNQEIVIAHDALK